MVEVKGSVPLDAFHGILVTTMLLLGNLVDTVLTKHGLSVQTQGRNIRDYSDYLIQRAISYETTKVDYVRGGEGRLMKMSVDKGLLRETESVQDCIQALLRCEVLVCYA